MIAQEKKKKMTKTQYLELIGRITSGIPLVVKVEGDKSFITLNTDPVSITLSDNQEFVNKFFNAQSLEGGKSTSIAFDVESVAKELGYDVEEFKLYAQRMGLYHEIGHALFTPQFTPKQTDSARKIILNFVEDARVETKISSHYAPVKNKLILNNKMLLSSINMDTAIEMVKQQPDKKNVAMLACAIAGRYAYGLSHNEPQSPAIRRMVEIINDIWAHPKYNFKKHSQQFTDEICNLLPGLDVGELEQENQHQQAGNGDGEMDFSDGDGEGGSGNGQDGKSKGKSSIKKLIGDELEEGMKDFSSDLKSYGVQMKNRDERNLENFHYFDSSLINQLFQTLKQIMGGKPSKQNTIDYDGHALDMEGVIEFIQDPYKEVKMYEKAGKREHPDMHIVFAIDSSGSMHGNKIESAKKGAINLSVACEKLGIKTCIMDFATDVKIQKAFDQPLIESEISNLCAGGGTDIAVSVAETVKLLGKGRVAPNTTCALIILSDGCDGSARRVAKYLNENPHIQMYMIGIWDDPERYIQEVRRGGGKCYGHARIQSMPDIGKVMLSFTRDFVRRCR